MKILFLIENPPIDAVSEWEKIEKYRDKGFLTPTPEFFDLFKGLEHNKEFENEILLSRKNIKELPSDGISWRDYYDKYYFKRLMIYSGKEGEEIDNFFKKVKRETVRIKNKIILEPYIINQLEYLIIGNFVYPGGFPITLEYYPDSDLNERGGRYEYISIKIHNQISPNELTRFIKTNKWSITALMRSLPPKPKYYISARDLRIMELVELKETKKDKSLTFETIAAKIRTEFGRGKNNEGSVKVAYYRAVKRIESASHDAKSNK